jgi:hypothetical protein
MTVAPIEKFLFEIDQELQGAIDELISNLPECAWRKKLENSADLILKLKAERDPLPSTSFVKDMLKRIGQKTRAVEDLLSQAVSFHCGPRSRSFVPSGEYASSGLMQPASNEPAVRLRA